MYGYLPIIRVGQKAILVINESSEGRKEFGGWIIQQASWQVSLCDTNPLSACIYISLLLSIARYIMHLISIIIAKAMYNPADFLLSYQ